MIDQKKIWEKRKEVKSQGFENEFGTRVLGCWRWYIEKASHARFPHAETLVYEGRGCRNKDIALGSSEIYWRCVNGQWIAE